MSQNEKYPGLEEYIIDGAVKFRESQTSTHDYIKPYTMQKLTFKTVTTGFGILILIVLFLSFTFGLVVRGVVELFGWGYTLFGLV